MSHIGDETRHKASAVELSADAARRTMSMMTSAGRVGSGLKRAMSTWESRRVHAHLPLQSARPRNIPSAAIFETFIGISENKTSWIQNKKKTDRTAFGETIPIYLGLIVPFGGSLLSQHNSALTSSI